MIEAAFKAFAGPARRHRARSDGDRRAQHEGDPHVIAIVDYGMGKCRSVEKALEHRRRSGRGHDHADLRAADGLIVPGVGAFPGRGQPGRARSGRAPRACGRGRPGARNCLGMQLFDASVELGGADGLGLLLGRVEAPPADGLKVPHIGWNLVRFERPSPLTDGLPGECALSTVHTFAPVPAESGDVPGRGEYRRHRLGRLRPAVRRAVPPREVLEPRLRLLENFAAICARGRVILYPVSAVPSRP